MNKMITILGPTASGKTAVAAALAASTGAEIISADSRQVYRRMDIGTGKDLADYTVDGKQIPYHLIDIAEPGEKYNVYRYLCDFHKAYDDIRARGRQAILCGGTGLYIEAVLKGYNLPEAGENKQLRESLEGKSLEELTQILADLKKKTGTNMHNTTDIDTAQRAIRAIEVETALLKQKEGLQREAEDRKVSSQATEVMQDVEASQEAKEESRSAFEAVPSVVVGIDIDRELRREKISRRLDQRLKDGMVEEIKAIIDSGVNPEDLIYYGLEYKYVTEYVIGRTTFQEMHDRLEIAIHQFAKRQMTWFRGMERRGIKINWVPAELTTEEKVRFILHL